MKNKLILLVSIVSCFLSSCDGTNNMKCRETVVTEMKTTEIFVTPDSRFIFVVRQKDGSVWWVFCGNMGTPDITEKYMIFPPSHPVEKQ